MNSIALFIISSTFNDRYTQYIV